jgi:DNA repair photolyase
MEALRARLRAIKLLGGLLSEGERQAAARDPHARRPPRPCGMTVHTGINCPLACAYCYIYDMGFSGAVKPYPLMPIQLAYAIAVNPHVAIGASGTLIAVGSVTEPFLPETRELAVGYMRAIAEHLGNPIQVSTKMPPRELAVNQRVDVLVSVTDASGRLEPRAPRPLERLAAGAELMRRGASVTLFVRPVVPGVTDREISRLLSIARDLGYSRVVFGTLRVTERIARRLAAFGVDVTPYVRELHPRRQVPVKYSKAGLVKLARDCGFEVLPSSCASNVTAHGQACALCDWGPCGDVRRLRLDVESDVREYLEWRGYKSVEVYVRGLRIHIRGRVAREDRVFVEQATRLRVLESPR